MINILVLIPSLAQALDDPVHTALLTGSSDQGYYFVDIYVGTPPQTQSLIVDTASSITTFPCSSCTGCGKHKDAYFQITASNTFTTVDCNSVIGRRKCDRCDRQGRCTFQISYSEGSTLNGYFFQDLALFGDELLELFQQNQTQAFAKSIQTSAVFGCTTSETSLFFEQYANGIMGLSPKTNTQFSFPNLVDSLSEREASLIKPQFSLCIGRLNGYMTIGQYDKSRHRESQEYKSIKYYREQGEFYGIKLESIKVGSALMTPRGSTSKGQGTFIDSGSTLVNVHREIADQFHSYFQKNCTETSCGSHKVLEGLPCYEFNASKQSFSEFAAQFPTFDFYMENNFTFAWSPLDYLTKDLNYDRYFCLPVFAYDAQPLRFILGQVWMRNWDILFDKEQEMLTFIRSNCSTYKVSHNFTEDELIFYEQSQSNLTLLKTRNYKIKHTHEFWKEILKIVAILALASTLLAIIWYFRKRELRKKRTSKQTLPENEQPEEQQPGLKEDHSIEGKNVEPV